MSAVVRLEDELFFEEQKCHERIQLLTSLLGNEWKNLITFELAFELPKETLEKYGLSDKISFLLKFDGMQYSVVYVYDGRRLDPPKMLWGQSKLSTLDVLRECIKQDTHRPALNHE